MPLHPDDEPCRGVGDDEEPSEPPDFPDYDCWSCEDSGRITHYHPSFDYPTGSEPCPDLGDPLKHPPRPPAPTCVREMPLDEHLDAALWHESRIHWSSTYSPLRNAFQALTTNNLVNLRHYFDLASQEPPF